MRELPHYLMPEKEGRGKGRERQGEKADEEEIGRPRIRLGVVLQMR